MVYDCSGSTKRLAQLNYKSLEALKAASDLGPRQKLAIERLACTKAFSRVERLFDEASLKQKEGDEEQSYQLYSRMGTIAELIIHKNDFKQFKSTPDGRHFYDLFNLCISRMSDLTESLTKRYGQKAAEQNGCQAQAKDTENGHHKPEQTNGGLSKRQEEVSGIDSGFDFMITPRQLLRFVEDKRQALIIDYRSDQSQVIKCERFDNLLVAHVPAHAIVPGCIGTSLVRSAALRERALLQRMCDVDLVVLLGSESAPSTQHSLKPSSKEFILFNALSTYNTTLSLRRPPVFLSGGFENWYMHYPMHTSSNVGASTRRDLTESLTKRYGQKAAEQNGCQAQAKDTENGHHKPENENHAN